MEGAGQGLLKGGYNAIAGGVIDKVTPKGYGGNIIGEGIIRKNNLGWDLRIVILLVIKQTLYIL